MCNCDDSKELGRDLVDDTVWKPAQRKFACCGSPDHTAKRVFKQYWDRVFKLYRERFASLT